MSQPWFPPMFPEPGSTIASAEADWADAVRRRLFEHRTILIRGVLDDSTATRAAAELMTLDATGDSRVMVHLDAIGETLEAAFTVMDVIDLLGVPVHVLCIGRAEGPAVGVLAVASRRASTPHARIRLCEPKASMQGTASDLGRWTEHHLAQLQRFCERVGRAVQRRPKDVAADSRAGRYLNADEALRYGLLDEISQPRSTTMQLPGRVVGFRSDL